MDPISHVKLFLAGRLPDWDEPIVIVTFEQTKEESFFAEYFILFRKSQRLHGCRFSTKEEDTVEFLKIRPPERVIEDVAEHARLEILGQLFESLSEEQQHRWILGPPYTLTPIELKELQTLWFRGRYEDLIRKLDGATRSMELKAELDKILKLPHWKFTEEKFDG
jgi:hypothetical protein